VVGTNTINVTDPMTLTNYDCSLCYGL